MKTIVNSVWVEITLWIAAVVAVFVLILRVAIPGATDWPSWVQAVGSIVAIAASGRIAQLTFKKTDALHAKEAERREIEAASAKRAAFMAEERRASEEASRQKAAIEDTQRLALQLMVKADESIKRLERQLNGTSHAPNVAFTAKGEFDAVIVGLKAVDIRHLDSFDKFEQCIHVLGACMAMTEHTRDWGEKGEPASAYRVIEEQGKVISRSASRFRELTGLAPLERTHAPVQISAYAPGSGPEVVSAHTTALKP